MPEAALSHSSCSRQHAAAFVAWSCIMGAGCVSEPPADATDMSAGTIDMARSYGPEDMAQSAVDATTDAPDLFTPSNVWTVTLTPVEWGLFAEDIALDQIVRAELSAGTSVDVMLPPGVWGVEMCAHDQCQTFGGALLQGFGDVPRESLPVSELASPARFFNAIDSRITLTLNASGKLDMVRKDDAQGVAQWSSPIRSREGVAALFDEALARINSDDGAAHTDIALTLMRQLASLNAGPITTSRGTLFLAPGEDGGTPPEIRGTFTDWEAQPRAAMRKIVGALWGRYIQVDISSPALYKTVYASPGEEASWFTDVANQHIAWDGFDTGGVGSFNSVWGEPPTGRGRMTLWWRVSSEIMPNPRDVYVYFPPGYDADVSRRYPVLYVHDGNESIARGQFHDVADAWFASHLEDAAILVFVALPTQEERFGDYTVGTPDSRGELYAKFLAKELVPRVDERLRTRPERGARGLMGASLGGLISYWTAAHYPDTFEYTAGMSSSFFWEDEVMLEVISQRGCQNLWFYLDSGAPADNADVTRKMRELLVTRQCRHEHQEQPGGRHEWSFWRDRFPNVLRTFASVHGKR